MAKAINNVLNLKDNFSKTLEKTGANVNKFERHILRTKNGINKFGNGIKGISSNIAGFVGKIGIAGAAIGGVFASAGGTMMKFANDAAGVTDRIDKMSQKLGMSRQTFQEWDFIASQSGLSVEQLGAGMKGLATKMDDAARGGKGSIELFARLGIKIKDTTGKMKTQEEVFEEAIVKLQKMEDGTEKTALASKLFGKSGQELIPLLNGAAGSVDEMKAKAKELGLVLSDDAIDAGVLFTDTMDQLKRSFSAVTTTVGVQAMPIIQKFCDWLMKYMPQIQAVLSAVFKGLEWIVSTTVNVVSGFFNKLNFSWENCTKGLKLAWDKYGKPLFESHIKPIITSLKDNWELIWTTVENAFNACWTIMKGQWEGIGKPIFEFLLNIIGTISNAFAQHMPKIVEFVNWAFTEINNFWTTHLQPCFQAIGDFLNNVVAPAFDYVFNRFIVPLVGNVFSGIGTLWETILKPILGGILDFITGIFTGSWETAWNGVKSVFEGIWNTLKGIVIGVCNGMIDAINSVISGINKMLSFKVPDWIPIIGGKGVSVNIPQIPKFATGTNYFSGGLAQINERGGEIVNLPNGSQVIPHEKSKSMLKGRGEVTVNLNIQGNVIGNKEFMEATGTYLVEQIKVALLNS